MGIGAPSSCPMPHHDNRANDGHDTDAGTAWVEALVFAAVSESYGWWAASRTKPGILFTR
jgi:hypothetical protein